MATLTEEDIAKAVDNNIVVYDSHNSGITLRLINLMEKIFKSKRFIFYIEQDSENEMTESFIPYKYAIDIRVTKLPLADLYLNKFGGSTILGKKDIIVAKATDGTVGLGMF